MCTKTSRACPVQNIWNECIHSTYLKEISGRWIYSGSLCAMGAKSACEGDFKSRFLDFLGAKNSSLPFTMSKCSNAFSDQPIFSLRSHVLKIWPHVQR